MKLKIHLSIQIPTSTWAFQDPTFIGWVEKPQEEWQDPYSIPEGYMRLRTIEVDVHPDMVALTARAIEILEGRKRQVRGEAEKTCTELEGTIQSFLAIAAPTDIGGGAG